MSTTKYMPLDAAIALLSSMSWGKIVPLLFFVAVIYAVLMICYNFFFHPLRGVPGPCFARISTLWQLRELIKLNHPFALKAAHKRYGTIIKVSIQITDKFLIRGAGPVIRIAPNELHFASPAALRQIYTQGKGAPLKFGFYQNVQPVKEDHLFSFIDKNMHLARKKIISRCFSTSHQMNFLKGVVRLAVQLNDLISAKTIESSEQVVDLYRIIHQFTFESMYMLSFEEPLGMMTTGEDHALMGFMNRSEKSLKWEAIFPLTKKYGQYLPGPLGENFRGVHEWKKYYIDRMRTLEKSKKSPFLSQLLNTVSEEHNRPLNESEAAEELIGLMFAGSGTTAATMNWLLWELASNPPIQEQLFEEIRQALASPTAVIDHKFVASLPFLKAVINETLRLHTAIIGNLTRIAVTDMVIDGQVVPKGTIIGMSSAVYHSDPNYFPEPERWNPSRWLSGDTTKIMSAFAPFSVGPRACIGQSLALSELTILVPSLCRRFKFSIPKGWPNLDMNPIGVFATHPRGNKNALRIDERTS